MSEQQTAKTRRNVSLVEFLRSWMNDPMPYHVIDVGADILGMEDYTPEKRAHQIVTRCVMAWMDADHGKQTARRIAAAALGKKKESESE